MMTDSLHFNWKSKENLQYMNQVLTHLIIVIASIINLSFQLGHDDIWKTLLFLSVGYICNKPKPKISLKDNDSERGSQ